MEQTAHILSKDGSGYLPLPQQIISRAMLKYDLATYGLRTGSGAIRHPDWGVKRIGFQPYPYESATREIVKLLKQTRVEGDARFLQNLDIERVTGQLFNYDLVKKAAERLGGLQVFEGVDASSPYVRTEIVEL
jgi:NitT/TauT family transport system substrate-binding protein